MSVSLLLFLVAIATAIVLFADSATQWSLRLILDEGFEQPRAKAEASQQPASAANAQASQAKAA